MEHIVIGLIVGIVMGLTGAGGALISIPLFITLLQATVKQATVLSLVAVIFGTLINLFGQKVKPDLKIVIPFVIFGAIANFLSFPLKALIPDVSIAVLLTIVGTYSVWSVWKPRQILEKNLMVKPSLIKAAAIGTGLGVMTTLTGLGGGVLLIPILKKFYGKNYAESLPSSLLTILLISTIAFLLQIEMGLQLISLIDLVKIALGTMGSFFFLKWIIKKLKPARLDLLRNVIFTIVTLFSITSVIIQFF